MAFRDFPPPAPSVELLQRSLERGRLAHAYLMSGHDVTPLETVARSLAQTLNCQKPERRGKAAVDACGQCLPCRKIEHGNHGDIHWVRPESKTRVITIDQVRELMRELHLKPTEAEYKVGIIVSADRLNEKSANAFLKTLEEPPSRSVLILLTSEPQRLLDTIVSRCLRLSFGSETAPKLDSGRQTWLTNFTELAAAPAKSLLSRYRLLDVLLSHLNQLRTVIEEALTAQSPLQKYREVEKELAERWESELKASIEAEYRRQRGDLLLLLQWWLRDVWLHTLGLKANGGLVVFPAVPGAERVAARISPAEALRNLQTFEQLQRSLHTNVQEALALEVGLLKLRL